MVYAIMEPVLRVSCSRNLLREYVAWLCVGGLARVSRGSGSVSRSEATD